MSIPGLSTILGKPKKAGLARNILSNWIAMFAIGLTSFVLTPIFIDGLGDFQYGIWILASSFSSYYGLLDLGLRPTLSRFVARFKGAHEEQHLNETLTTAFGISLALAVLVCVLTAILVVVLPPFFKFSGETRVLFQRLILIVGADVAFAFPGLLLGSALLGLQRFDLYSFVSITSTVVRAVLQVIAIYLKFGVLGIAVVALLIDIALIPVQWWMLHRADRAISIRWRAFHRSRVRELASFGFFSFLINAGDYLRFYTDSVVIGRVLGAVLVTPFNVAGRLMGYFRMGIGALTTPFIPRMSEVEGRGNQGELRETYLRGTKIAALFSVFVSSLLFLDGKALLGLWVGERFVKDYGLLMTLTLGYVVTMAQRPSTQLAYAQGRHRVLGLWMLGEGVANVLLSIYWARQYGLMGVALGTTLPMLVTGLIFQPWYVLRGIKLPVGDYVRLALLGPILAGTILVCVAKLVMLAFAGSGLWWFICNVGWQTALFGCLAYWLGLSVADREVVWESGRRLVVTLGLARMDDVPRLPLQ
jgi:O-antigen/teichoic acid export membrane protein